MTTHWNPCGTCRGSGKLLHGALARGMPKGRRIEVDDANNGNYALCIDGESSHPAPRQAGECINGATSISGDVRHG